MADWKIGDLALCVKLGPWRRSGSGIKTDDARVRAGMVLTVRRIEQSPWGLAIWFIGIGADDDMENAYKARRFRKITPGADIEGIEVERRVPIKVDA